MSIELLRKLGDWMELPGFRKLEYSIRTKEHKSGSNPNTQGDGWLDFFLFKKFHNKVFNTTLLIIF